MIDTNTNEQWYIIYNNIISFFSSVHVNNNYIILKLFHACAIQLCQVDEGPVPMVLV